MSVLTNPEQYTLEDCKGEIYFLYITQNMRLSDVREVIQDKYNVIATPAVYKNKLERWGYRKNTKRIVVTPTPQSSSSDATAQLQGISRPNNMVNGERSRLRKKLYHSRSPPRMNNGTSRSSAIKITSGCISMVSPRPQSLTPPDIYNSFDKIISDTCRYIRGSFENKSWRMNGMELLIISSAAQEIDKEVLHSFLTAVDTGCSKFAAGNTYLGGLCWRKAFTKIEVLVRSNYHDVIPNIIQKINDLRARNHPQFAEALKSHVAALGTINQPVGHVRASIYRHLGTMTLDQMKEFEEKVMKCFADLFEIYLGDRCYNTFVMDMNLARRRVAYDNTIHIEDFLPAISILDSKFGPTDRRPLHALTLRIEWMFDNKRYTEIRPHCLTLLQRAEKIPNDEWLKHYFLIKGTYCAGIAATHIPASQLDAEGTLSRCYDLIEVFYTMKHHSNMFDLERTHVIERLETLTRLRSYDPVHQKWRALAEQRQQVLEQEDNSLELLQELSIAEQ